MSLRVAFVVGPFPQVSETFIQRQVLGLLHLGVDVHIFPERKGSAFLEPELEKRVHYAEGKNRVLAKINQALEVSRRIGELGPFDIVHIHFGHLGSKYAKLREDLGAKLVVTFHGYGANVAPKKNPDIYKHLVSQVDQITTNSLFLKGRVLGLGFDEQTISIVPVGIHPDLYPVNSLTNKFGFISVGRLHEAKGFEYAIEAYQRFSKTHPDARYTIVGDGNYRSFLEKKAQDTNIKFVGSKTPEEVSNLLRDHRIFVMPSVVSERGDEETQGVVLQEAQASELIYIASDIGGVSEGAAKDCGWLVESKNSHTIYQAMLDAESCRKEWNEMGKKARAFVKEKFDIKELSVRLLKIYESIL